MEVTGYGNLFEDKHGRKYMVTGYWTCPVVSMRPLDGGPEMIGGMGGEMWSGFKRTEGTTDDVVRLMARQAMEVGR